MPRSVDGPAETGGEHEDGGLSVRVTRRGTARIVTVVGELDRDTADGLRHALVHGSPDGRKGGRKDSAEGGAEDGLERIVVDLGGLWFCDSTGLNLFLQARAEAEAAGLRLELAAPSPMVVRLFAVTGADGVLRVHPDLGSALGEAGGPGPGQA
ncbi:STAS domain-containing protein [Kitasatospora sp. NPDC089797]|uniref:STAS domain-containing protein n=1 Tax=Kitasatospora sp. NPDC089797 TaxID=3155298 RepID=UPI003424F105